MQYSSTHVIFLQFKDYSILVGQKPVNMNDRRASIPLKYKNNVLFLIYLFIIWRNNLYYYFLGEITQVSLIMPKELGFFRQVE